MLTAATAPPPAAPVPPPAGDALDLFPTATTTPSLPSSLLLPSPSHAAATTPGVSPTTAASDADATNAVDDDTAGLLFRSQSPAEAHHRRHAALALPSPPPVSGIAGLLSPGATLLAAGFGGGSGTSNTNSSSSSNSGSSNSPATQESGGTEMRALLGAQVPAAVRAETWRSLRICLLYGATSSAISLIFKSLLSGYGYNGKFLMLAYQLVLSLAFCAAAKRWFRGVPGLEVPDLSWPVLRHSLLPGAIFVANIVVGWYGLQLVNVPMFLAIRRTNAAFTLVAEWALLNKTVSPPVASSVLVIVAGAVLAGAESLRADWLGFAYTLGNNVCTAASMSLTKRFSDTHKLTGLGVVLYNAVVALPLCILGAAVTGEVGYTMDAVAFPAGRLPSFWVALTLASAMGVFMSYIVFLCTTVNSPLATSITGNLKDVAATLAAAALFGDFVATRYSVGGLAVSFAGAAWFSAAKLREAAAAAVARKVATEAELPAHGAALRRPGVGDVGGGSNGGGGDSNGIGGGGDGDVESSGGGGGEETVGGHDGGASLGRRRPVTSDSSDARGASV